MKIKSVTPCRREKCVRAQVKIIELEISSIRNVDISCSRIVEIFGR